MNALRCLSLLPLLFPPLLVAGCGDDDAAPLAAPDDTQSAPETSDTATAGETRTDDTHSPADATTDTGSGPQGDLPERPVGELSWSACAPQLPIIPGTSCGRMDVPLNWDDPQGESIEIAVLQVPGQGRNVIGTLWFLDGGPGGTGVGLADDDILGPYRKAGFDIYIPVHRGTGMSTPLTCSQPIFSNMPACANELVATWGEGLAHFRSAQAGRDLGALIQAAAPPAQPVFVYGTS